MSPITYYELKFVFQDMILHLFVQHGINSNSLTSADTAILIALSSFRLNLKDFRLIFKQLERKVKCLTQQRTKAVFFLLEGII